MSLLFLHLCFCSMYMPSAHKAQERALDPGSKIRDGSELQGCMEDRCSELLNHLSSFFGGLLRQSVFLPVSAGP